LKILQETVYIVQNGGPFAIYSTVAVLHLASYQAGGEFDFGWNLWGFSMKVINTSDNVPKCSAWLYT